VRTAVGSRRRVASGLPVGALVWAVAGVSLAGFVVAWVLAGHNHDLLHVTADTGPDRFLVTYPVVGAVLASRMRSNPIGWFLLGMGVIAAARGLAGEYALDVLAAPSRPGTGVWAAWFTSWSLTLVFPTGLLLFVLLLFPEGRPPTARWAVLGWLASGLGLVYLVINWLDPAAIAVTGLPSVPNPTGVRGLTQYRGRVRSARACGSRASAACCWRRRAWWSGTGGQPGRSGCSSSGSPMPWP